MNALVYVIQIDVPIRRRSFVSNDQTNIVQMTNDFVLLFTFCFNHYCSKFERIDMKLLEYQRIYQANRMNCIRLKCIYTFVHTSIQKLWENDLVNEKFWMYKSSQRFSKEKSSASYSRSHLALLLWY